MQTEQQNLLDTRSTRWPEIAQGIEALDRIARCGTRLSPNDDVDRALEHSIGRRDDLSPAEVREIRAVLLRYALDDLHRDGGGVRRRTP